MELVVQLLFVLALLGSFFQMSQWGLIAQLTMVLAVGLGSYWAYPWILDQSKQQLSGWLANPFIMQDLATIQMIEALGFIMIDLSNLKFHFGQKIKRGMAIASFFPGVVLVAAILFFQMTTFYQFSHIIDFGVLGVVFSVGAGLVFLVCPQAIKWIIPEGYLRMELRYILSFGQVLCSVVITIFCQRLPYTPSASEVELQPLLYLVLLLVSMFLVGWVWSILKVRFKWKY